MFKTTLQLRSNTSGSNSQPYEPGLFDEIGLEFHETGKPWSPVDPPLADVTALTPTEPARDSESAPTEQLEPPTQDSDTLTDMVDDDTVVLDDDEITEYRKPEPADEVTVELPTNLELTAAPPPSPEPVTFIEEPSLEETVTTWNTAPIVEEPAIEDLIAESPLFNTPIAETRIAESPLVDVPVVEASVPEPAVTATPVVEAPVAPTAIVQAPVAEVTIAEPPAAEPPDMEQPIMEAPAHTETIVEPVLPPPTSAPSFSRTTLQKQGVAPKKIGSGRLVPARLTWKPRDPFACPTQPKTQRFRWEVMLTSACITAVCGLGCVWILRTLLA